MIVLHNRQERVVILYFTAQLGHKIFTLINVMVRKPKSAVRQNAFLFHKYSVKPCIVATFFFVTFALITN